MTNSNLSILEMVRYARNQQSSSFNLREVLGLDRGDLCLQAKHFPFSIMTYNMALLPDYVTAYCGTNRTGAKFELIERIKADPPDVVGLCEVFKDGERDTIRSNLLNSLGQRIYPYYSEGPDEADIEQDGGLLLLSKYRLNSIHHSIYRDCRDSDCLANKGVIHIQVHPRNSPTACDIFFSHMQDIAVDEGEIALYNQLTHLGHMVRAYSDPHTPTFIMGDLNIPADVSVHYDEMISRLGMPVDLWLTKYSSPNGFTNIKANNFYSPIYLLPTLPITFSCGPPEEDQRLDYILLNSGQQFVPILKDIELLKWTHKGRQISDHFGLLARFEQLLEVGIGITGVISEVSAIITGFLCIETTSGPGHDEVSFTIKISDQHGNYVEKSTPIIGDVDNYEHHRNPIIRPAVLHGDPDYINIEVKGREHDDLSDSENIGKRIIQISKTDLLLNKGRSFNRVMPYLKHDGEYGVEITVSVA